MCEPSDRDGQPLGKSEMGIDKSVVIDYSIR